MDNLLDINEVADYLGVSVATVRNWIKNGSISFSTINKKRFDKEDIEKYKAELEKGTMRLNSRRNKSQIKGNHLSKKYISSKVNFNLATQIIDSIIENPTTNEIRVVLAEYCYKLYLIKKGSSLNKRSYLLEALQGSSDDAEVLSIKNLVKSIKDISYIVNRLGEALSYTPVLDYDDFVGLLFMGLKSLDARKNGGVYYTPTSIVQKMMNEIGHLLTHNKSIVDPCCGSGNFLISAIKHGASYEDVFGMDVDEISVELARFNVILNSTNADYEIVSKNILCCDSLMFNSKKFDICIGNPPWGSEIDTDRVFLMMNFECASSDSVDAFDLFLEKGLSLLKQCGILYFVVPEALLNVGIHKRIRGLLLNKCNLKRLIYWGNAFDGVQAPAISLELEQSLETFEKGAIVTTKNDEFTIKEPRHLDDSNWPLSANDDEYMIFDKIAHSKVNYLKGNASFALGIVTGDNKKYVLNTSETDSSVLIKGFDVYKYKFVPSGFFIKFEPEKFQQVAKKEFYFAPEKLIYRFICDTLVFAYDNHQTLSLNSANILIPNLEGYSVKFVMAMLNSRFAHFFFKKQFNSVKVLRNHIESIPLPLASKEEQSIIESFVNQIINEKDKTKICAEYDEIDDYIMNLYEFSEKQKNIIRNSSPSNEFLF
ncbi:MAG TPA: N-6 DNA methylase [Bacilli bacterium]|nr:N-6 DNA methylase [Bacilli bacterium]